MTKQSNNFIASRFFDLAGYNRKKFFNDLAAGITVGIVALPLSLALAIATGVPPVVGLYTAGIAGFVAAVFAGSPFSVSGPAAAIIPVLVGIISVYGLDELPFIGIVAGFMLILFALLKVGTIIAKIPESIVLGFTAGVAIVIFFGQLNTFLGLSGLHSHEHFHEKVLETISHLGTTQLPTIIIGVVSLLIITQLHRVKKLSKIPATLPAVILTMVLVSYVGYFSDVATVGAVYGAVTQGFPTFDGSLLWGMSWFKVDYLFPAFKIALLISVESLLCALVADKMTKTKHRSNQELVAQGIANIVSPLFMGIPATAVIARTGTIVKANAKTRVAAIVHALVVVLFFVALAPVATRIPLTALAAVLLVTAVRISEYREINHYIRSNNIVFNTVLVVTLVLTVFTDLVIGVSAGLCIYFLYMAYEKFIAHKPAHDGDLADLASEEADDANADETMVD